MIGWSHENQIRETTGWQFTMETLYDQSDYWTCNRAYSTLLLCQLRPQQYHVKLSCFNLIFPQPQHHHPSDWVTLIFLAPFQAMLSYILVLISSFLLYHIIKNVFSLRRNIAIARSSGIPYIVLREFHTDIVIETMIITFFKRSMKLLYPGGFWSLTCSSQS